MNRKASIFFSALLLISTSLQSYAEEMAPWVKGETWNYQHEGPVPFRGEESKVVGDRVMQVLNVEEGAADVRWTLKENWGDLDDAPRTFRVDADRKVHRLLWGDDDIAYEPALPMDYTSLKPGEEQTDEIMIKFGESAMKCTVTAKRLPDQDVVVPAGTFEQCVHVKIDMKIHFGELHLPIDHQVWYHPRVNFLVKEKYFFKAMQIGGLGWGEHTCLSELKEYKKP
ncbi:MAG: hypothetical protein P9L94_13290 [Candidatus Hinthialibacter antarcticus]|nr:hypothetical protein [Candidatus Hinthialibacter antarcticus]